mmetsp:Transcript_30152/g.87838  ORF Transcript_30152/g.87838 Transcript_30152/m.87838 type:complete len:97 (+) Transcript_30152:1824-2114(+)
MWPDVDAQKIDRTLCPDIPPLPTPGLAMALWSVYHTSSFSEAVERCVNLLGDADSTGSMAGQMAGAIYGFSGATREGTESRTGLDGFVGAISCDLY